MECQVCTVVKLPDEFPPETVTELCDHPPLICLRCTISKVDKTSMCPTEGCGQPAKPTDQSLKRFQAIIDTMFKEYHPVNEEDNGDGTATATSGGVISVNLLTGEGIQAPYQPGLTVLGLKKTIEARMKHDVLKQKLLFNEKELTDFKESGEMSKLSDFGVKQNSSLCLIVLLYSVPEAFDNVIFDLHWGYPGHGCDFLDASCLLFNRHTNMGLLDYRRRQSPVTSALSHSGDVMDDFNEIGHHTIKVSLKQIPSNVTHLFFTLSAWNSPTISHFPNPSLKFYESSKPSKDLCKTTFNHAMNSQAIIMCSVSRGADGRWKIFESGKLSAGNAKNYQPIITTIQSLISSGL